MIRKATAKDYPEILALMNELIDEHSKIDSYYKKPSDYSGLSEYIADTLKDRNKLLLVAEQGGRMIAYFIGAIEEAPYYSSEKEIGVVSDTVVAKKYRRRGMLKGLFQKAQEWFGQKKVKYIELSVDARNKEAVTAWRKLGFSDYKLRLKKDV